MMRAAVGARRRGEEREGVEAEVAWRTSLVRVGRMPPGLAGVHLALAEREPAATLAGVTILSLRVGGERRVRSAEDSSGIPGSGCLRAELKLGGGELCLWREGGGVEGSLGDGGDVGVSGEMSGERGAIAEWEG